MHTIGRWYVQGVEIAWPSVSGASHISSPWALLIMSVQARILHGRKQWERHKTRYGIFGAILGELRIVSLARLRPCTESWPDFTYIRADYAGATSALSFWQQGARASARPCSRWSQLCYGELQAWRAWMLLDDLTCARTWSPSPRALWPPGSIRSAGSSLL